ncbi:TPA: hypothetical protein DEB02_00270 [Candidatus Beckwithbacteria bacterium]|nr:hypothetical protein [Candidatus Beckwithbacteria bacterium]
MSILAKDFLKTEGILTGEPNDSLASALAKLNSSHGAVFVTEGKKLLGLISPYHVLYRSNFPGESKLKNCLFRPPKLSPDTPVAKIARLMVESKVYYLPVVDLEDNLLGIVSYRRILRWLKDNGLIGEFGDLMKPKAMISIKEDEALGRARTLMKPGGVSRLMVTAPSGKLIGILTRYDLRLALAEPQNSQKSWSRAGSKDGLADRQVRPYIKRAVATLGRDKDIKQAIELILTRTIGSVVFVNNKYQPVGLVSVHDILNRLAEREQGSKNPLSFNLPDGFRYRETLKRKVRKSFRKLSRRGKILTYRVTVKQKLNRAGKVSRYEVIIGVKLPNRAELSTKVVEYDAVKAVNQALDKIAAQME